MQCDILTLFPEMVANVVSHSIVKRAQDNGLVSIRIHNIRDFSDDRHRVADDTSYGGGSGMIMKAEPIFRAIEALREERSQLRIIVPSPQGRPFTQRLVEELSRESRRLVWICGHYEGIDERVLLRLEPEEISLGDYVLTGGELPALVMIDAAVRLVPGVVGDPASVEQDSFAEPLLDFPHYTKPQTVRGCRVPDVLLSGNHEAIRRWRRKEALRNTYCKRPDLLQQESLTQEDQQLLSDIFQERECREGTPVSPREGGG
jgi:tRNA (guanine37-N1)-methyltransferase